MSAPREWLCEACDWIGSPTIAPDACPECGEPLVDITVDEDEAP
jgi:rubrerythrin